MNARGVVLEDEHGFVLGETQACFGPVNSGLVADLSIPLRSDMKDRPFCRGEELTAVVDGLFRIPITMTCDAQQLDPSNEVSICFRLMVTIG